MARFFPRPLEYQFEFIKKCYDELNGVESATLEEAKTINETADLRCVGLCVETRPDYCGQEDIERILKFGATRVEMGVQVLDDAIFDIVQRGHYVEDIVKATDLLKKHGYKVHYHWMPGLPGSTPEHDREMSRILFDDPRFKPDGLKLYPTMVVSGTELETWWKEGKYEPYADEVMFNLIADIKTMVPPYVRISRVLRDIPAKFIVAGLKNSLRGPVKQKLKAQGLECQCIRCREYGHRRREDKTSGNAALKRLDYQASDGQEIFLSFEDEYNVLYGLLRLRIQPQMIPALEKDLSDTRTAIVRELHVYGSEVPLRQQDEESAQHRGFGKALLKEAERIASEEFGIERIFVLSGVGAREYYRESGYKYFLDYMMKELK